MNHIEKRLATLEARKPIDPGPDRIELVGMDGTGPRVVMERQANGEWRHEVANEGVQAP
ncbi:hypothetical protein LY622_21285 [Halomonas sp. M5N1S17]|uniref:hypothetical protein n=1 Tax=Halomonas alkalisoli TaxID=2907158 RepID=UPI001F2D3773|nr:hypothetical protein [Halomonas alkalisoli]MCE9665968.1 hypothetical protein [Halomonas alkalisoli]MCE9680862.1 hypothetical protein [Halomonas alkalisoli]